MPAAILLIVIGAVLAVSAFKGIGVTDVLDGVIGDPLDPHGPKGYTPTDSSGGASKDGGGGKGNPSSPGYPLPTHGKDLGGVAAHKARPFGNWQSDNAVDIGVPKGTSVLAVAAGTIQKLGGHWDGTGQSNPNGYNVTLKTADNVWFYTHLMQRDPNLKVGSKVTAGQVLGLSGAANGVEHLHIASQNGDPEKLLGV